MNAKIVGMGTWRIGVALAALSTLWAGAAVAGPFGGFAGSGRYLRGGRQLCTAVSSSSATPSCRALSPAEAAALPAERGVRQKGSSARYLARAEGTRIVVVARGDSAPLATWDGGDVIGAIGDIYLSADGRFLAVEYTRRLGGRELGDAVVVSLANRQSGRSAPDQRGADPAAKAPSAAAPAAVPEAAPPSPALRRELVRARRFAGKNRWPRAARAARAALALDPALPEALFWLSLAELSAGDQIAAKAALERLAGGEHPERAQWLVEARLHPAFAPLRERGGVLAVDPARASAYERLVGAGGRWEQAEIPCREAGVSLALERPTRGDSRFDLVIRSRCQGSRETTRLDGRWQSGGRGRLDLIFPNGGGEETMSCRVEVCGDRSGEDCLRCAPEEGMEFLLRTVRR